MLVVYFVYMLESIKMKLKKIIWEKEENWKIVVTTRKMNNRMLVKLNS